MMKKPRRTRISCFKAGQQLADACIKHFAPKSPAKAEEVFQRERRRIGKSYGFIVMHQGNLKRDSYVIVKRCDLPWTEADTLAANHTAFPDFASLVEAKGYRPSLNVDNHEVLRLADFYDTAQETRGDNRRAMRFAKISTRPKAGTCRSENTADGEPDPKNEAQSTAV